MTKCRLFLQTESCFVTMGALRQTGPPRLPSSPPPYPLLLRLSCPHPDSCQDLVEILNTSNSLKISLKWASLCSTAVLTALTLLHHSEADSPHPPPILLHPPPSCPHCLWLHFSCLASAGWRSFRFLYFFFYLVLFFLARSSSASHLLVLIHPDHQASLPPPTPPHSNTTLQGIWAQLHLHQPSGSHTAAKTQSDGCGGESQRELRFSFLTLCV